MRIITLISSPFSVAGLQPERSGEDVRGVFDDDLCCVEDGGSDMETFHWLYLFNLESWTWKQVWIQNMLLPRCSEWCTQNQNEIFMQLKNKFKTVSLHL